MSRHQQIAPALREWIAHYADKDEALAARAAAVAQPQRWRHLGMSKGTAWGECKSGGVRWFRTAVQLEAKAQGCNCSVPQPCKHAVALRALSAHQPHLFVAEAVPAWVSELLTVPPDPGSRLAKNAAQRARSRNKRLQAMIQGMGELERWLTDLLREGLASLPTHTSQWWQEVRARLVDAKLGALARRIETHIQPIVGQAHSWPERVASEMAWMHLLARAFAKWDELPADWQDEIMQLAGAYKRKPELEKLPEVQDEWLVLHVEEREEGSLYVRRAWLWGAQQCRPALLLNFAPDDVPWQPELAPAQVIWAAGVWYPGASPQRFRIFRSAPRPLSKAPLPKGHPHWTAFADWYAEALLRNPFLREVPIVIEQVRPARKGDRWWLVDKEGRALHFASDSRSWWRLLACSSSAPLHLFGEWDGFTLRPLAAWIGEEMISLAPHVPLARRRRRHFDR